MSSSILDFSQLPRWKILPGQPILLGGIVVGVGLLIAIFLSVSSGIAIVSLGIAVGLGGWALVVQWRSERFDFLEAHHDLYSLRENLDRSPERIEWITWASTIVCRRAHLASASASPSEREGFLKNLGELIKFANPIVADMEKRAFRQLNHLLLACEELDGWDELSDGGGNEVVDAFSQHLGEKAEEVDFRRYIEKRTGAIRQVKTDGRYDDAFDKEYFLSLLDDE